MRLKVDNLRIEYGSEAAVQGISLEVRTGEVVGIVGPNGAGKSSTLNAIVGLVRPAGGSIQQDGEDIAGRAPEDIVRRGISLIPEGRRLFAELTVEENLALGLTVRERGSDAQRDLEMIIERFPVLESHREMAAGKLSGGEQQQLAIARALVSRPQLLLLDEPSLGLAPRLVDQIFEILAELRADGVTMLLVEQNVKRTIEFADRTYIMRAGRVELSGEREELQEQDRIAAAYLGGGV